MLIISYANNIINPECNFGLTFLQDFNPHVSSNMDQLMTLWIKTHIGP